MPPINYLARASSTYRVTFDGLAWSNLDRIGRQIADVLHALHPVEIRVAADEKHGALVAYVVVPADVMPEAIDTKADALRAKWAAAPPEPEEG